jgi:hypothetical protein
MDTGKLKSAAIIILLCVNLAFGGILIFDGVSNAGAAARERSQLTEIMANNGIEISPGIIPRRCELEAHGVVRSRSGEAELVAALIGQAKEQDQGGNIYYYENANGWVRFRSSGSFEACLYDDGRSDGELLEAVGAAPSGFDGGKYTYFFGKNEIFNCGAEVERGDDGIMISGRRLMGEPGPGRTGEYPMMSTVLIRFLERVVEEGIVCTRIDGISPGYMMSVSAASAELRPVWRISADSGAYCVWADSGEAAAE